MNIVKWITDVEMEISVDSDSIVESINKLGFRLYKHPVIGKRLGKEFFYIRLNLSNRYSLGAYTFPKNEPLEKLCIELSKLGFIFWRTFKTEISPYDYMVNLQRSAVVLENFKYIQAGKDEVLVALFENA